MPDNSVVIIITERVVPRGASMYMGDPDGPLRFIKSLGMEVPTYINPRPDLKTQYRNASAHISVDYHIPPDCRGPYFPKDLANYDPQEHYPLTETYKVRCGGLRPDGQICQKSAQNRTGFCTNHGGALHPADKLFASERGIMPSDPSKLTRLQRVEMGMIQVRELTDEEIAKQQVLNDDGTFSKTTHILAAKIIAEMRQEFFERADRFVRENALDLMEEMRRIAMSTIAEDKDKIQAITWLTERALGKTPDVLITNKTDAPFDQLMGDVTGGSRAAFRQNGPNPIGSPGGLPVFFDQDDDDDDDDDDDVSSPTEIPLGHCKECGQNCDGMHVISGAEAQVSSELLSGANNETKSQVETRSNVVESSVPLSPMEIAKARKEQKDRIKRHRNRKYAAKAQGMTSIDDDLAFDIQFKVIQLKSGPVTRMKIITPEQMKAPRMR